MPGRRQRRRERGFRQGSWFLEPVLLLLLHRSPAHGYALIEQMKEFGLEQLNPGMVYRALRGMDTKGWLASTWDTEQTEGPPRRVYHLTAPGDEVLGALVKDLEQAHGQIGGLIDSYNRHMTEGRGEHH